MSSSGSSRRRGRPTSCDWRWGREQTPAAGGASARGVSGAARDRGGRVPGLPGAVRRRCAPAAAGGVSGLRGGRPCPLGHRGTAHTTPAAIRRPANPLGLTPERKRAVPARPRPENGHLGRFNRKRSKRDCQPDGVQRHRPHARALSRSVDRHVAVVAVDVEYRARSAPARPPQRWALADRRVPMARTGQSVRFRLTVSPGEVGPQRPAVPPCLPPGLHGPWFVPACPWTAQMDPWNPDQNWARS